MPELKHQPSCCPPEHQAKPKVDWFFWSTLSISAVLYLSYLGFSSRLSPDWVMHLTHAVFELTNTIWWGILLGILMVAVLGKIPRELVMSALGTKANGRVSLKGIIRATIAGILLDLCSHGILMIGSKLYKQGASFGQVAAFLLASPWNSFSLTIILIALIGFKYTLLFILLSMIVAIVVGVLFEWLIHKGKLPANPNNLSLPENFNFKTSAKEHWQQTTFDKSFFKSMFVESLKDSKMVIKWVFFGVLLAAVIRTFISTDIFTQFFGASILGLMMTIVFATIIEVCSEGSTPIAADILTRANAPGNSFAFLMTGVATDYTEVMVIKEATRSWKIALFLPLLTVPQVIVVAWILNQFPLK